MSSIVFVSFAIATDVLEAVKEVVCKWLCITFAVSYYAFKAVYLVFEGIGHVAKNVAQYTVNCMKKEIKSQKEKI